MAYAIMRFEKHSITEVGGLAGSLAHTFRSRYTPNADPKRIADNETLVGVSDPHQVVEAIQSRYPKKPKKNNVGCYEFMVTYSPEADIDPAAYFDRAISWLEKEFGAENVVSVVRHNDETTPHIAAYVVPIDPDTGRLNARRWTGGKALCSALQTRFWEHTGRDYGLERGVKGSQAKHMTIAHWYGAHQSLDERENVLKAREKELSQREKELSAATRSLKADLSDLSERETALEARAAEMADSYMQQQKDLSQQREAVQNQMSRSSAAESRVRRAEVRLSERESALDQRQAALDARDIELEKRREKISETEQKLAALERELASRGVKLAGGEAALVKRQAEIDNAGQKLQERLQEARKQQEQWKALQDDWLSSHAPVELSRVQRLSLEFAEMPEQRRMDAMGELYQQDRATADAVHRLGWVSYDTGHVTPEGRRVLVERGGIQEHEKRLDEWPLSGLDRGPDGP